MKSNLLHICFVLDESGSMYSSTDDVIKGFNKLVDKQKKVENGECIISVYRFSTDVKSDFIGKPLNEIPELQYHPGGCTAMNDGIGTAIDEVGLWLSDMDEADRPSKNLIVIMTDGEENSSKEYTFDDIKYRIKHQEEKYNWSFVFMGTDLNSLEEAKALGISMSSVSARSNVVHNYEHINTYASSYRFAVDTAAVNDLTNSFKNALNEDTLKYSIENNIKV